MVKCLIQTISVLKAAFHVKNQTWNTIKKKTLNYVYIEFVTPNTIFKKIKHINMHLLIFYKPRKITNKLKIIYHTCLYTHDEDNLPNTRNKTAWDETLI